MPSLGGGSSTPQTSTPQTSTPTPSTPKSNTDNGDSDLAKQLKKLNSQNTKPDQTAAKVDTPPTTSTDTVTGQKPGQAAPTGDATATPAVAATHIGSPGSVQQATDHKPGTAAAAAANPPVDFKGTKVTMPNAQLSKLGQELAGADPNHPLSLAEACQKAGITPPVPGQDPGQQVAPDQAKAGDLLVAGGKDYLFLGNDKYYDLQTYSVVSGDQVPQNLGDSGGFFHLNNPSEAAGAAAAAGTAPTSGPTAGVQYGVPGGDQSGLPQNGGATPGHTGTGAGGGAAPGGGSSGSGGSGGSGTGGSGSGTGGAGTGAGGSGGGSTTPGQQQQPTPVTSSGQPGVPSGGATPVGSAASTNTGAGSSTAGGSVPSVGGGDMDPSAVTR
ncbi:hypothetical protein [Tsukamurella soli]